MVPIAAPSDEERLFAAVLADLDDDAARQVWADALLARQDPRGELIALQLAKSPKHAAKIKALTQKHWRSWVGALALGAAMGTIAVVVRQEIVLFIMGGLFVAEAMSVMVQVLYFKYTGGKRIFRMAPLHHHYELGGWKETQVVVRFWIITIMLVLFGLSTLKLR